MRVEFLNMNVALDYYRHTYIVEKKNRIQTEYKTRFDTILYLFLVLLYSDAIVDLPVNYVFRLFLDYR